MSDLAVSLEPLAPRHLEALAALVESSPLLQRYGYGGAQAREHLAAILEGQPEAQQAEVLVAVDHEAVLGFAWVLPRGAFGRSAYLKLILVAPEAAGKGVGRALITAFEERHLTRAGLFLLCTADNTPARRFYERLGYRAVGKLEGYVAPGLDEVIYFRFS